MSFLLKLCLKVRFLHFVNIQNFQGFYCLDKEFTGVAVTAENWVNIEEANREVLSKYLQDKKEQVRGTVKPRILWHASMWRGLAGAVIPRRIAHAIQIT